MQRKIWWFLALSILVSSHLAKTQPRAIFEEAKYALVTLRVEKDGKQEYGTGFVVDSTAYSLTILTNRHVVAKNDPSRNWDWAEGFWLTPFGGQEFSVADSAVRFFSDGDDVAILQIGRWRMPNFRLLTLSRRLQFDGMKVYALSFPVGEGRPRTMRGSIESRDEPFYNIAFEVTGGEVLGGESGSPVLNERGIVIGMVTEKFATEKGNTNRVLHATRIRGELERFNIYLSSPGGENQIIALPPIDLAPAKKQGKWSNQFIEHLTNFISHNQEIQTSNGDELDKQLQSIMQPRPGYTLSFDEIDRLPSYILRSSGRKAGKLFILDISLRLVPGEQVVMNKRVEARNLRNLADSVGVYIVQYFGYRTKFVGVPHVWREWSLRIGVAGLLPTFLLAQATANSQSDYERSITSRDADSDYNRMHRNGILRNAMAVITGTSLIFWNYAVFKNPRKPILEKEAK